jgi:hypothetical protein
LPHRCSKTSKGSASQQMLQGGVAAPHRPPFCRRWRRGGEGRDPAIRRVEPTRNQMELLDLKATEHGAVEHARGTKIGSSRAGEGGSGG